MAFEQNGPENHLPQWVEDLLHTKRILVLATSRDNAPYCSLMCFAPIPQERSLLLATARSSVKFRNLEANQEVSLLLTGEISFASGQPSGNAVTFLGRAGEVGLGERPHLESAFVSRFPGLASFARSPETALVRVRLTAAITSGDVSRATRYPLE